MKTGLSQSSDTTQGAVNAKIAGLGKRFGQFEAVVGLIWKPYIEKLGK